MRQPWFKLYTEARTDPKVKKLTRDQHYVWFNLLCYAAEQSERGTIYDVDIELLALEVADEDIELLKNTIERLKKLRMITFDDGILTFIHFMDRQYDNPSDRPDAVKERVKRHRETSKQDVTTCNDNETTCNEEKRLEKKREEENRSFAQNSANASFVPVASFSEKPIEDPEVTDVPQPSNHHSKEKNTATLDLQATCQDIETPVVSPAPLASFDVKEEVKPHIKKPPSVNTKPAKKSNPESDPDWKLVHDEGMQLVCGAVPTCNRAAEAGALKRLYGKGLRSQEVPTIWLEIVKDMRGRRDASWLYVQNNLTTYRDRANNAVAPPSYQRQWQDTPPTTVRRYKIAN